MARYVVMEPPGWEDDATERALILRDGFAVLAFLFPPLWLLWHRLWIEASLVFAAVLGLTLLGEAQGFGLVGSALSVLLSIYVGLEGANLRNAALRRRGWKEWGALEADSQGEAEIRYAVQAADDVGSTIELPWTRSPSRPRAPSASFGLMSYPGRS